MELLFYVAWSVVFWIIGAALILTGVIPSGAPSLQLVVLGCGALAHAASASELGSYMLNSERFSAFRQQLTVSWQNSIRRGTTAGGIDVGLTAGLFMLYPFLPDMGGAWAIGIMFCILLLPPFPVFLFVVFWFTRSKRQPHDANEI